MELTLQRDSATSPVDGLDLPREDMGLEHSDANFVLAGLTAKQRQVLDLLIEHKTSKEIARQLGISPHTVDQRIQFAKEKLGAASRNEAAAAYRNLVALSGRVTCRRIPYRTRRPRRRRSCRDAGGSAPGAYTSGVDPSKPADSAGDGLSGRPGAVRRPSRHADAAGRDHRDRGIPGRARARRARHLVRAVGHAGGLRRRQPLRRKEEAREAGASHIGDSVCR